MDAPLIAVTASFSDASNGRPARVSINASYLEAVEGAGGVPVALAPGLGAEVTRRLLDQCHGLMLTGGGDVLPARYGEEAHPELKYTSAERDTMEFDAIAQALRSDLPLLALCRGMQVLNVALGGSLWQDLPSQRPPGIRHAQEEPRDAPTHDVRIAPGSRLSAILGGERVRTNSLHHQGLKDLGEGVCAVAWTNDGLVEGVEVPGYRWVLGVQWHPEELTETQGHARRLFEAFVAAARG